MIRLRIVFMGTPTFAATCLAEITASTHQVVGVVTVPDKPAGRGQRLQMSAVKEFAIAHNLNLLQPNKLKSTEFIANLQSLKPDVIVVVAFRMLPKEVWQLPAKGTFNLHASLLPNYRGAAPINWAIINGETETGVTTFMIDEKIDTGAILLKEIVAIEPNENVGQLHDKLMYLGAKLIIKTLNLFAVNDLKPTLQVENNMLKDAPKLNKENCIIDWHQPLLDIHNKIRGLNPYPTAYTYIIDNEKEELLKIFSGNVIIEQHSLKIGVIITTKSTLKITTQDGFYSVEDLQLQGKKRMLVKDFLNGFKITINARVLI